MKRIVVEYGEREQLARLFKTSRRTIYSALSGQTKSKLALRIRRAAIERGGFESR